MAISEEAAAQGRTKAAATRQRQSALKERQRQSDEREQTIRERKAGVQERKLEEQENPEPKTRVSDDSKSSLPSFNLPSPRTDPAHGHKIMLSSWLAGLAIISWQEMKINKRPPDPNKLVGWSAAIALLDLSAPLISEQLAGVFAVGLVLGLMLLRKPKASPLPGTDPGGKQFFTPGQGSTPSTGQQGSGKPTATDSYGTGTWIPNALENSFFWVHYYTATEAKAAGIKTNGNAPGKSPPWRWDPAGKQWLDTSKLTSSFNNPKVTPSFSGPNATGNST